MHNQAQINEYFKNHWREDSFRSYSHPLSISKLINKDSWILDVGCGKNSFKKIFPNVVGIDPAFDEADVKCTIEDYIPDRLFDVGICLGSINFGGVEIIERQIKKIVSCMKINSTIFWRLNPGRQDHGNDFCKNINFFPWTFEILNSYATMYNYKQQSEKIDEHSIKPRLYAEWHRIT
jgi:hypothetical protein